MDTSPRDASPESPPSVIPPPWVFKTKLYLFTAPLKPLAVNQEDPLLRGLLPGAYNPEENIHPSALAPVDGSPAWKGGISNIIIVRYEDSPIGAYDELISSFDGFANPFEKNTSARITNIYVDSRKSIWHGRKNWNIPKHLARFEFNQTNSKTLTIKVSLPDAKEPLFSASVTESYIPSIPIPSFILNTFNHIVQPPILPSNPPDLLIGSSDEWISMTPQYRGRWRLAYIQPSEGGNALYGDGVNYPQFEPYWIGGTFSGDIHLDAGVRYSDSGKEE